MDNIIQDVIESRKSIIFVNLSKNKIENDIEIINLSDITTVNNLKKVFDEHIYPSYSNGITVFLELNEEPEYFYERINCLIDKKYDFSFTAEKAIWHLKRNFYILNIDKEYNFHEMLLTPIELMMKEELDSNKIEYEMQKKIGDYIVDFLIHIENYSFIVECDGKEFHDIERDSIRDDNILKNFGISTLRFSGSQIYNNIAECVVEILKFGHGKQLVRKTKDALASLQISNQYDKKQLEAIQHELGACLVLAPAGSGKTSVLIQRIIELIKKGVKPNKILAITFTKKAQEEMSTRLIDILGSIGENIEIKTYHGLAFKYMNTKGELLNKNSEFIIENQIEKDYGKKIKVEILENIAHKVLLQEDISMEDEIIFDNYKAVLKNTNKFTFNILITEFCRRLMNDLNFRKSLQSKWDFLLIDECQDNNKTQQMITKIIAAPQDNVFFVGDDDQCIYTFAGSSISNVTEIKEDYPNLKEVFLEYNYRCDPEIVEAATNVIVSNNTRKLKTIKPGKSPSGSKVVYYKQFDTKLDEAESIAKYCLDKLNQNNNIDKYKIAILYRSKYYIEEILFALERYRLKYYVKDTIDLLQDENIKIIHSYLMCIYGSDNNNYWKTMLRHGMTYISNKDLEKVYESKEKFKTIRKIIEFKKEIYIQEPWKIFYNRLYEIRKYFSNNKLPLTEMIAYIRTTVFIKTEVENEDTKNNYKYYLELAKEYTDILTLNEKIKKMSEDQEEGRYNILLFTIHSSKGKQFDEVFLVGLNEMILPSYKEEHPLTSKDEEEERRICYVGITRAVQKIYMCTTNESGMPSRFIDESREPKMRCKECDKNIPKDSKYICPVCNEYFCPDHILTCHNCGKTACIQDSQICVCGETLCNACAVDSYCTVCNASICKQSANICSSCGKYICDEHVYYSQLTGNPYCINEIKSCENCKKVITPDETFKCEICGKLYCKEHSYKCSITGKYYCYEHLETCSECGKKLSKSESVICSYCDKLFCKDHSHKTKFDFKYYCNDHAILCSTCNEYYPLNKIVKCEWCGNNQCVNCLTTIECETCKFEYCNKCIIEGNCNACTNKQKELTTTVINYGVVDVFNGNKKVMVGISKNYLIYFEKKALGLLNGKVYRLKRK